jgi:hypothetical protein
MDREVKSFSLPEKNIFAYGYCMDYLNKSNDLGGVLSLVEICALVMHDLATRDPGA